MRAAAQGGARFDDRVPDRARKKLYKRHQELADRYPDDWPVSPVIGDVDDMPGR